MRGSSLTGNPQPTWQDRAHGDDGTGEGRAVEHPDPEDVLSQGGKSPRCCASPGACTSSAAGSSWRPSSTPEPPHDASQGHRRGLRPHLRRRDGAGQRHPQGQPLHRADRQGRRGGARAPDRPARPARPPGAGPAPAVVSGGGCDAVAAWRGAFLAHGSLTEPRPLVLPRGHLPGAGGGARARRSRPAPGDQGEGPRRSAASTGS